MGSEMALKAIEMKKIAVFDGVCTHLSSPSTPSTLSLPSLSPVLLLMSSSLSTCSSSSSSSSSSSRRRRRRRGKDSRSGMTISYI
jgi:hypothetical protein